MKIYLDIETDRSGKPVILGICKSDNKKHTIQLIDKGINRDKVLDVLRGVRQIVTYNGDSFDLPKLNQYLSIDFKVYDSKDLMYECHRNGIYGGLVGAEKRFKIKRTIPKLDMNEIFDLWDLYIDRGNKFALGKLLLYNKDDVQNLVVLEEKLELLD